MTSIDTRTLRLAILLTLSGGAGCSGCVTPPAVIGEEDAGVEDAGSPDASDADAGEADAGPLDAGPPVLSNDEFVERILRAHCEGMTHCFRQRLVVADVESCLEIARAKWPQWIDDWDVFGDLAGLLEGRRRLDPAGQSACLESMARMSCGPSLFDEPWRAACRAALLPLATAGEACVSRFDCVAGTACETSAGDVCDRRCVALAPAGCGGGPVCPEGQSCRTRAGAQPICADLSDVDGPCALGGECLDGLECFASRCRVKVVPPPRPCACGDNEICDRGPASCVALPLIGEACTDRCAPGPLGALCFESRCVVPPSVGEPCAGFRCAQGAFCFESLCVAPRAGEPCLSNRCAVGAYCFESTCRLQAADGAACGSYQACLSYLCVSGHCAARPVLVGEGAACGGEDCAWGLVCVASATGGICAKAPVEGAACPDVCVGATCATTRRECGRRLQCSDGLCQPFASNDYCDCPSGTRCLHRLDGTRSASNGFCVAPAKEGEPCLAGMLESSCEDGLDCAADPVGDLRCARLPSVGAPCTPEGACDADATCVVPGAPVCVAVSRPREGDPCWVRLGAVEACADSSLLCVPLTESSGRCLKLKAPGEACTELLECGGQIGRFVCDVDGTGTCVARPGPGEACVLWKRLGLCDLRDAWCDLDAATPTCRPFRAVDERCERDEECGYFTTLGYCLPTLSAGGHQCRRYAQSQCL